MATNVTIAEDSGPVLLAQHSATNGISMAFAALTSVASNGTTYIETYINGKLVQTGQTGSAGQNVDYVFKVFYTPNPDAFGDFGTVAGTFSSGSVLGNDPPTPFSSVIHVTPVPDAPNNIAISNTTFNENVVGAFVGTLSASDPDGPTTFNYQLFSDPSGLFEIRGADLFVKTGRAADFEARSSYDITIRVFDNTNLAFDKGFTIKVGNVNEAPTISSNGAGDTAVVSILENTTSVTKVVASDPDSGTTLAYSVVGGADADKFLINASTGILSFKVAPNFEVPTDTDHNNSYIVQVRASDGSLFDTQTITVNVADVLELARKSDFNADGTSDVFWRNDSTGHVGIWEMHNNVQTWHDLGGSGVDHKAAGIGDFSGDGTADVLWRNDSNGHVGIWEMHNNVQTWHDLGGSGVDHKVAGIGDFNGDGTADVLWRNDSNGHVGIWEMHNNLQTWHDLGGSGTDFKVAGIGDFNGDHTMDVLWRNDSTGHVGIWEMHNNVQTWHDLGGSGTDFKVAGIGDYNGDGTSDVFWRNNSDGHVGIWEMHNNVQTWHDLGLSSGVDHSFIV